MNNCFNPIIISFMSILIQFCLSNKALFMTDLEYSRMSAEGRKIYLKKAFDKAVSTLHSLLEHEMLPYFKRLADEGSITEDQKATYRKAQEAFEVAEVVQAGIDKQEYAKQKRFSEAPIKMMSCFLHNDPNPSMNYVTSDTQQGFHCFGCMESEKVIDVFGLINLYGQWQGKGSLPFTNQLVLAEQLFVNGDVSNIKPVYSTKADFTDSTTDYIRYTGAMSRLMHNPYTNYIPAKCDKMAMEYLLGRGIGEKTATRLGVMCFRPRNRQGEEAGRTFLVFICSDGTFVKRLIHEDKEKVAKNYDTSYACPKWSNKKNCEIGVFNGQVIEHCIETNEPVFICEGAFDALSCEELGFHAVAINSANNINNFLEKYVKGSRLKAICLADTDTSGRLMAREIKNFADAKVYIPETYFQVLSNNFFQNNEKGIKDINDCLCADRKATYEVLYAFRKKANEFFGY